MGNDTLEIFDFDWTLFRSPGPPDGVARKTFIHSPASLEPPHVPWRPGKDFWIEAVVREMKAAQRRRGSLVALITARRMNTKERIEELLGQKHLEPDYFFIRSAAFQKDKDRIHFKRKTVINLLRHGTDETGMPSIGKIVIWEDEKEQIESIRDVARRHRIEFEGHLVRETGDVRL